MQAASWTNGQRTLNALKKAGLSADPQNYLLWFTHLTGANASLTADLEKIYRKKGYIDQQDCANLAGLYFKPEQLEAHLRHSLEEATRNVASCLQRIKTSLFDTHPDTDRLKNLLADLYALNRTMEGTVDALTSVTEEATQLSTRMRQRGKAEEGSDCRPGYQTRRFLDRELPTYCLSAHRSGTPLSLLLVATSPYLPPASDGSERNNFESALAGHIENRIRGQDRLCRYDEECFALILPDTDEEGAWHLGQKLSRSITALTRTKSEDPVAPANSLIFGIAEFVFPEESAAFRQRAKKSLDRMLSLAQAEPGSAEDRVSLFMKELS